ncbi:AsmA-like C-terminal region-containing protein [Verrucomicrobiales bacterium BCK34]|nr:AsmA-like C-terminal region-containing protein [Verrucomicrobiales bacterium BCK34]
MRIIRRLFVTLCILAACLIVWGAVYARKQGFTRSWRDAIEVEFEKRGYYVEIGKLTLGAFRGLVAEDVKLYEDEARLQEVAFLDDVYLDVDLSNILNKKILVKTLDVQDASLSLPIDPGEPSGSRLKLDGLSGRIVITESVIEILKAEAEFEGIIVSVKGTLLRGTAEPKERDPDDMLQRRKQLMAIVQWLRDFEFEEEKPLLDLEFSSAIGDLMSTTAKATLHTGGIRKQGAVHTLESLDLTARFNGMENTAVIERFRIRDRFGEFELTGQWSEETNLFQFDVDSSADLIGLASWFSTNNLLREVVFFQPAGIKASGELDLNAIGKGELSFPGKVTGDFRAGRLVTRGTVFSGLDFGFSLSGERIYLRNLRLDHKTGVAFLNLKYEPGKDLETLLYETEITLDPLVFRPFFSEKGRKFIDAWNFGDRSNVYITAAGKGSSWSPATWQHKGEIDLRQFRLNGVDFVEMEADVESDGSTHWFRDIVLTREEGRIVAELAECDVATKQWTVKGVVSTVNPIEGAQAFSPKLARHLTRYRFEESPTIRLSGLLDARRPEEVGSEARNNFLEMSFSGGGALKYDFLGKTLDLSNPSGEIKIEKSRVNLTRFGAGVFGGNLDLKFDALDVRSEAKPFAGDARVTGVPLEAITKLYGDVDSAKGLLDARLEFAGGGGSVANLQGRGAAKIVNGNLFAIPLLGPLSKVVSGGGRERDGNNVAKEASATFEIVNGIVKTSDLEALTNSFRVKSVGELSLVDKGVDFEAVVNTRDQLSSAILTPVSELLTYSCTGTWKDPVWKPKHISNLGRVPAQLITEMTNAPVEGLKKLGQGLFGSQKEDGEVGGEAQPQRPLQPFRKLFQKPEPE